jgi:hypothetical protein
MKIYFNDEGYCTMRIKGFDIELVDDTLSIKSIESPRLVGLLSVGATHSEPNYVTNTASLEAEAHLCGEAAPHLIRIPLKGRYWLGNPIGERSLRGHYCP